MTPRDHPVEHWIESLVDRTARQLRAELEALVSQLQEAAVARAAERAWASHRGGSSELTAGSSAARAPVDLRTTAAAVLEAVVALDSAESLSDTLDILADRAARHADRVLLVVQREHALTGWRWHDYTADPRDAAMLEIPAADEGLVARAARSGVVEEGSGPAAGHAHEGSHAQDRGALAVPLCIDGRVVAVLYVEEANSNPRTDVPDAWAEVIQVLARHAARCLESMTARRVPELVRAAAAALEADSNADNPTLAGDPETARQHSRPLVPEIP